MKKKNLAIAAGAVAMVGVMAVGGTLAFLTNDSNTATNVFTGDDNDLKGKIIEDFDYEGASSYLPGDAITKAPKLTNESDSIDAYVAAKVTYYVDGEEADYTSFTTKYADIDFNTAKWTAIDNDKAVWMYNDVLGAGEATDDLFSTVTVKTGIETVTDKTTKTVYSYDEVKADYDGDIDLITEDEDGTLHYYVLRDTEVSVSENETTNGYLPTLQIVVKGYMVQAKNLDAASAAAQLLDLVSESGN